MSEQPIRLPIELPFERAEQFAVTLLDRTVTIAGEGFSREVALPPEADVEHLTATLVDRVLELRAPRTPPRGRPIPVRTPYGIAPAAHAD
jgi:HSP20 family molecular chaperone IbpA